MKSALDKIVTAAALLIGAQLLAQVTGLAKQVLIAAQFGTSESMDAYLVAMAVIGLILTWVSLPLSKTIIPMFRYDLSRGGEQIAWANASILFNNLVLVVIVIALMGWGFAPYLVRLMAPGFESGTGALATSLTQIGMVSIVFAAVGGFLSRLYFAYERFFVPGFVGSIDNVLIILGLLAFGSTYGIYGLTAAVVLGAFSLLALQAPILWEKRKFYALKVNLRHPGMAEMAKLSFPLLISRGGAQLARVTDRIFASLLPTGSLSALDYARRLTSVQYELLVRSFNRSTFPHFTRLTAEEDFKTLSHQLFRYLRVVSFLTIPMAIGVMVLAEVIVRLIYQRGAFGETSVRLTSQALAFYAIGFPANSMAAILNNTFFSLKDTRTPTKIALLEMGIKILLSWVLTRPLAHIGIALAESISQLVTVPFLILLLPKQVKRQQGWKTLKSFAQTLTVAAVMGGMIYLVKERIDGVYSIPLELAALASLGAVAYGVMGSIFQREEAQTLFNAVMTLGTKFLPNKSLLEPQLSKGLRMKTPDFFLVGAPRCGTTAMIEYLRQHPDVFIPRKKELYFFGSDLRVLDRPRITKEDYVSCFSDARDEKRAGEGSVWYLHSKTAALEIRAFAPSASIIIMLRNPVDMMYSLHSHHLYTGNEDIEDFEAALEAEEDRKRGLRVPKHRSVAGDLLYRDAAKYARQVKRYLDVFGRENVLVIIFDDFTRDPASVFRDACGFLGVENDFHPEFRIINSNKRVRSRTLQHLVISSPRPVQCLADTVMPGGLRRRLRWRLRLLNTKYESRPPMKPQLRRRLQAEFLPEVERLSELLGRDLTHWCQT